MAAILVAAMFVGDNTTTASPSLAGTVAVGSASHLTQNSQFEEAFSSRYVG